jgi:hypothetical protein
VQVFDGPSCGWKSHDDDDLAAGSIRSLVDAARHPIAHPNCRRAFGPRPDIESEEQAAAAKPITANTGFDDVEQPEPARAGGVPSLAGTPKRPGEQARERRQAKRAERAQGGQQPVSVGDAIAELGIAAAAATDRFPANSEGQRPDYGRSEVDWSYIGQQHVWSGDDRGGPHDPFGPYVDTKTLFPRRWLNDEDSDAGREAAEQTILAGVHQGTILEARLQRAGDWLFLVSHDDVVYRVHVQLVDGKPAIWAAWPVSGRGVQRVELRRGRPSFVDVPCE